MSQKQRTRHAERRDKRKARGETVKAVNKVECVDGAYNPENRYETVKRCGNRRPKAMEPQIATPPRQNGNGDLA